MDSLPTCCPIAIRLIRAAAIGATAKLDPDGFVVVLSGLDVDPTGAFGPRWRRRWEDCRQLAADRPKSMLDDDTDQRVIPAVLAAREGALPVSDPAARTIEGRRPKSFDLPRLPGSAIKRRREPRRSPRHISSARRAYGARAAAASPRCHSGVEAAKPSLWRRSPTRTGRCACGRPHC